MNLLPLIAYLFEVSALAFSIQVVHILSPFWSTFATSMMELRHWCIHDDDRNLPRGPHSPSHFAHLYEATIHGARLVNTQGMSGRD